MKRRFTVTEFREAYPNDDACLDKLFQLRYNNLVCPKCESDKAFNKVKDRRSYQCPGCGFQIYPTQGTIFQKTTTPLTYWFLAIYMQTTTRNGVAAKELERTLNVCYKTALRMNHQIKLLMANTVKEPFTGVIQADESFFGGLNKNRHADKKIPESQGRSCKDKTPVFGMVDLKGNISAHVVSDTTGASLKGVIDKHVKKGKESIIVTDEWMGYSRIKEEYQHIVINHLSGEYVRGGFHNNTIEGFWSQLKRTIKGTHIHVSRRHLQKYVDEVAFRYEQKDKQDTMFDTILSHVV
ncbi:MAG: IS1595 family transposase [Ferruginibacter sp.]